MASKQDFQMTSEELERFKKSMKDKEFKKLFFDYMNEISDPNNKKLYEEELAKLEGEKGYNVRYVKPTAEFCIKTWLIKSDTSEEQLSADSNPKDVEKQKCFINVCSSSEIDQPAQKNVSIAGGNWDIPYSLANGRVDVDHEKKECMVYDVVYHPIAFEKSKKGTAFKTLLAKTALEGLAKQFKLVFSKKDGYKILENLKSKGAPLMTMIREKDESLKPSAGKETSLEFIEKLASSMSPTTAVPKAAEKSQPPPQSMKPKLEIPSFKIIHQNTFSDYQKFTGEKNRQFGARPDSLVIRINLPKVASASIVDVDLGEKTLDLVVPEMYKLHLDFPFPVKESESSAKFDKSHRVLSITVPVIPAPTIEMEPRDDIPFEKEECKVENLELQGSALIQDLDEENALSNHKVDRNASATMEQESEAGIFLAHDLEKIKLENGPIESSVKEKKSVEPPVESKTQVDDLTAKLANTVIEEELYNIQPPFQASQTISSISFIIPISGIDSSSVKTFPLKEDSIFSSFKIDFKSNDGSLFYTLHLEFPQKAFNYEVSVTPSNLCVLVLKREEGLWKTIKTLQKGGEMEEMTLILPETIPGLTKDESHSSYLGFTIEAKQKKDLVVIEATRGESNKATVSAPGSSSSSIVSDSKLKKTVFVNSALFDLD